MANPKVCPPVTANSDSLPEDLIIDILLRLPVKCLLRFRAVSKTWLSLLSSPSFIGWHAITNNNTFIVHRLKENDHSQVSLVHLDSREIGADLEFPYSKVDFSFPPRLLLVGSCNGIICAVVPNYSASFPAYVNSYRYQNHNTYLWNPVTKHSKLLPPHTIRENRDIRSVSLGFGFDPIGNDYKVVRTVAVRGKLLRAEVYSSNRNDWRKIEPNTMAIPNSRTFDVCLNGFLCCTSDLQVMTFDLNKEVFNYDTYFPPEIKDKLFFGYRVITLEDDSLGVIMHGEDFFDGLIRLWRVDAAASIRAGTGTGTGGAWTPMFIVETTLDIRWIHGYINNGDILIKEYGDKWVLYNADKKEKLNFLIGKSEIFKYTESLVSIAGFKQIKWCP